MTRYLPLLLIGAVALFGCTESGDGDASEPTNATKTAEVAKKVEKKADKAKVAELTVDQVDGFMAKKSKIAIFDANSESTRKEKGVIPTATLLPSSSQYELSLLPSDKDTKLIFYCGSESCSASDTAAARAAENGYSDVCVLRAGIKGWKAAGKPTKEMS